jgi:hypothetical protein
MYWLAILVVPSAAFALRPGPSSSRRLLACALVTLVPVAGLFLAYLVRRVRGGAIAIEPDAEKPARRLTVVDVTRLGETPPVLDRLLTGDPAERLEALVALSSAGDADAVAVLRWALEHGPSDVVLDAALTLEEIELRAESRAAIAREMLGSKDPALAIAAADAAAFPVLHGIADAASAPLHAEQARSYYNLAREWAPEQSTAIDEKLARLELAAGCPRAALEILDRLICETDDLDRITQLRDDAAFAARDFDLLSFTPAPLEVPTDLRRASCKRSLHEAYDPPRADPGVAGLLRVPA